MVLDIFWIMTTIPCIVISHGLTFCQPNPASWAIRCPSAILDISYAFLVSKDEFLVSTSCIMCVQPGQLFTSKYKSGWFSLCH